MVEKGKVLFFLLGLLLGVVVVGVGLGIAIAVIVANDKDGDPVENNLPFKIDQTSFMKQVRWRSAAFPSLYERVFTLRYPLALL